MYSHRGVFLFTFSTEAEKDFNFLINFIVKAEILQRA